MINDYPINEFWFDWCYRQAASWKRKLIDFYLFQKLNQQIQTNGGNKFIIIDNIQPATMHNDNWLLTLFIILGSTDMGQ